MTDHAETVREALWRDRQRVKNDAAFDALAALEQENERLREEHDQLERLRFDAATENERLREALGRATGSASYDAHAFEKATGEDADWTAVEFAEAALTTPEQEMP